MPDGRAGWVALEDGRLPGGCSYRLLPDGWETGWSALAGTVHLYASWDEHRCLWAILSKSNRNVCLRLEN